MRGKQVALQSEFHLAEMGSPLRGQISDLGVGGRFVETMLTKPAGLKLDVVLWLGEARISLRVVIATCAPQVGNGIHSARKSLYYREFPLISGAAAT